MVLKRTIGLVFAGALAFTAFAGEVVVRIAPPRILVEKRGPPPSRNHVWVNGYHRWDGNAYNWTPGSWQEPPRHGSHWVAHHWSHQRDGWVMVEGHWR
jgi:hypothetical protein